MDKKKWTKNTDDLIIVKGKTITIIMDRGKSYKKVFNINRLQ
jgi:hypothetical protein